MKAFAQSDPVERSISRNEILAFLLIGLVVEFVQGNLLPGYLRAQAMLVLILYVGWNSPPGRGASVGTLFGLAQDYLLGVPLGLNGLSKTLLGFTVAYLSRWTTSELGFARGLLLILLALIDRILVLSILLLLGQPVVEIPLLEIVTGSLLTGFVGEVFFRLYDKIKFPPKDFGRY